MPNLCLLAAAVSLLTAVLVVAPCMLSSRLSQDEEEAEQVAANVRRTVREYDDIVPALPIEPSCRLGRPERVSSVRSVHRG